MSNKKNEKVNDIGKSLFFSERQHIYFISIQGLKKTKKKTKNTQKKQKHKQTNKKKQKHKQTNKNKQKTQTKTK